ncbi:MAG: dihydroneopterin aldolase [Verrucomicrobiota bacterium]|nr:dihydroneopterin aldolase [Verrucomicrobiota bacterium]
MDKMCVNDLRLKCVIGTRPEERKKKQAVLINLTLESDLRRAGRTDDLPDTVNYKRLAERIVALGESNRFFLIERLADRVAALCLEDRKVKAVTVRVDKPGALPWARSAAVEIRRAAKR